MSKNHLLALSFDSMASPKIYLSQISEESEWARISRSMGMAWYPNDMNGIAVVKDFIMLDERIRSSTFLAFSNEDCGPETLLMDLQPFFKPYAGKDWVWCSHPHQHRRISTHENLVKTPFDKVGNTISESTFCFFLFLLNKHHIYRISEMTQLNYGAILKEIIRFNPCSFVVSDGESILVYRDKHEDNALYTCRIYQPHHGVQYAKERLVVAITDPLDNARTMVIVSNRPISEMDWEPIPANMCTIICKGQIVSSLLIEETAPEPATSTSMEPTQTHTPSHQFGEVAPKSNSIHYQDHPLLTHQIRRSNKIKRLSVYHQTVYTYEEAVEYSKHSLLLTPVSDNNQNVLNFNFQISQEAEILAYDDVFGNRSINFTLHAPYKELKITAESVIEILPIQTDFSLPLRQISIPLFWTPWQRQMMSPYLLPVELPETELQVLSEYAMSFVVRNNYNLLDTVLNINDTIYRDYQYLPGSTTLHTTPYEVFSMRKGVCQDFANLFVCLARLLNIPARYRVGYIYTGANYENKVQSEASHGWIELYLPYIGWLGFDPTNDVLANQDHIRVACGRNYVDASPTSGTIYRGGKGEKLQVNVKVIELS